MGKLRSEGVGEFQRGRGTEEERCWSFKMWFNHEGFLPLKKGEVQ